MPYTQLLENPARGGIQQRYLSYCGDWDYLALFYRFKFLKRQLIESFLYLQEFRS